MSIVTCDLSLTLDGVSAGPHQTLEQPFGEVDGEALGAWMFDPYTADHQAEADAVGGADAHIMGRNMFSPGRGEWDLDWTGWWGPNPPYHSLVFVLTHHEREPVEMQGGTTYHFVTGGPGEALARAREAAGDGRVAIAGGATTVNEYLAAGEIDELRLHVAPFTAGVADAVRLFDGVGPVAWTAVRGRWTPQVTHLVYRR